MARWIAAIALLLLGYAAPLTAQDAEEREMAPASDEATNEEEIAPSPKVVVVLVGDPDAHMRSLAQRVDRALADAVDRPQDVGIRNALIGEPGQDDDGLTALRNERRRLGLDEARDAPVLRTIGRQAAAVALVLVRTGDDGPEVVVFDVRRESFFDGRVPLSEAVAPGRIATFVLRRARAAARPLLTPVAPQEPPIVRITLDPNALADTSVDDSPTPDLFEQIWPYLVVGALLAAAITAVVVGTTSAPTTQPVLRFEPGGR